MEKIYKFETNSIKQIKLDEYPEDEFCVASMDFLGSNPNSHGLDISNEVFKKYADTVLGKFLVADVLYSDCGTHSVNENIKGYVPKEQSVQFVDTEDGYVRGIVNVVISRQYAKDFVALFDEGKKKSVSVEMKVEQEEDSNVVLSYRIFGITVLGDTVRPSSPGSTIEFTRFSEEEATKFFTKIQTSDTLSRLKQFAKERKRFMAKEDYVSHPINTSKDALYEGEWDGEQAKQDLVKEKNYLTLAPKVCLRLEEGWKDREVTKLGYPVMGLYDGEWRYSKKGLSSALGYAEKEKDEEIVKKVKAIYKKLGLDEKDGKEEDKKMAKEVEFAAVDIGNLWSMLWDALATRYPDSDYGSVYRIEGVYEESNQKFVVIRRKDEEAKYRLNFSLTTDGLEFAEDIVKVELEIVETDEVRKFAEPEDADKFKKFEDDDDEIEGRKAWAKVIKKVQSHEGEGAYVDSIEKDHIIYTKDDVRYRVEADVKTDPDDKTVDATIDWKTVKKDSDQKMSEDEMMAEITKMKADIESRDNIIMEKDKELGELRAFKKAEDDKQKAMSVEAVMADVKDCVDAEKFGELRDEGLTCDMDKLDAWSNKVKSFAFEAVKKPKSNKNTNDGIWRMSAVVTATTTTNSLWK